MESATATSRRQHITMRGLVDELTKLLEGKPLNEQAIQRTLSRLTGVLKVHIAMEIEGLYPQLLAHEDNGVSALATQMVSFLRAAYDGVLQFRNEWTPAAVRADPTLFIKQANEVIAALSNGSQVEEEHIYTKIDEVYAAMQPRSETMRLAR
jgi:hypothetical protein